jgi:hypothetical protein
MPSGIYICRASINAAVMRIPENMHIMAEPIPGPFDRRHRMKADAVRSSTAGYCMETGALQYRHRPFRNNQDRTGTIS